MSNNPKRHHHLAQTIQRNFLEKGSNKLWWYSRETNTYEERTPRGIAHGRNTYTLSSIPGEECYALEVALSKVEDKAGPPLRKLERSESVTQEERNAVAELLGFQHFRTPSKIALIQKVRDFGGQKFVQRIADRLASMTDQDIDIFAADFASNSGKKVLRTRDELVEGLRARPPRMTSTKEATLDSLVEMGTDLAVELSGRSWIIVHAPRDSSFITSSEGIFSSGDLSSRGTSPGPAVAGVISVFPFARHAALVVQGAGPASVEHQRIHKQDVREINDGLAQVSGEIYGSPKRLLESIVERSGLALSRFELVPDFEYLEPTFDKALQQDVDQALRQHDE